MYFYFMMLYLCYWAYIHCYEWEKSEQKHQVTMVRVHRLYEIILSYIIQTAAAPHIKVTAE